jgi:hypothetical protein
MKMVEGKTVHYWQVGGMMFANESDDDEEHQ